MTAITVENFFDTYFSIVVAPQYAVAIEGEWGCGKTFYIKQLIEKLGAQNRRVFYISLYGIATKQEIDQLIFAEMHPFRSSKSAKFATKVLAGLIKASIKIDINENTQLNLNSQIPDVEIPNSQGTELLPILIFDDLERCAIEATILLGYINHFVEHAGLHVVVAVNELDLPPESNPIYKKMKEKVIGFTFKARPDFDSAFTNFISALQGAELVKLLLQTKVHIRNIFDQSSYNNLRALRSGLLLIQTIHQNLGEKEKANKSFFIEILDRFFPIYFELRRGTLSPKKITQFLEFDWSSYLSKTLPNIQNDSSDAQEHPFGAIRAKYDTISHDHSPEAHSKLWQSFFSTGTVDITLLNTVIDSSPSLIEEATPTWKKFWWWRRVNQSEFDQLLNSIRCELESYQINNIFEVAHVYGTLMILAEHGLLGNSTPADTLKEAKFYVAKISADAPLFDNVDFDPTKVRLFNDYAGLGYPRESLEFDQFREYVKEIAAVGRKKLLQVKADELLNLVSTNPNEFSKLVADFNSYASQDAIFKYIAANKFLDHALNHDSPYAWGSLCWGFEKRFGCANSNSIDFCLDDLGFYIELLVLLCHKRR